MPGLFDNYLREVETSLRAEPPRKRQIVEELRAHLHEKAADTKREHPEMSAEDVERSVLRDFGSARDLALGYEPDGYEVLRNREGDIVFRLGEAVGRGASYVATAAPRAARAVGRGTGKVLKVAGIVTAVVLVVAAVGGVWAYYEFKPYFLSAAEDSIPLYEYEESCTTPCDGTLPSGIFFVKEEARHVHFALHLHPTYVTQPRHDIGQGQVDVRILDPDGTARFNRTFSMTNTTFVTQSATWGAAPGNWTVEMVFYGFVGRVSLEATAWSLPWDP